MVAEPYLLPELDGAKAGPSPPDVGAGGGALAQAEAEARRRGYEEGKRQALQEVEAAGRALVACLEALEEERTRLVASLERQAAELAVLVAEKIVGEALALDPGRVVSVVGAALRRVAADDRVVVAVHPADLETVRAAEPELARQLATHSRLEVVPDRRVDRGGCVVSTAVGEIDARVREQLTRAREVISEALADTSPADG